MLVISGCGFDPLRVIGRDLRSCADETASCDESICYLC
jgi:hypothetical protein